MRRRLGFTLLTLSALALALGMGAALWHAAETSSVMVLQMWVEALKPVFTALHFLMISLAAVCWPVLANALHRWGWVGEAASARLLSLRWRVVTWLVVIELMLGQNLPGRFLAALQGSNT